MGKRLVIVGDMPANAGAEFKGAVHIDAEPSAVYAASASPTLKELSDEFAIFFCQLLINVAHVPVDPVAEFIQNYDGSIHIPYLDLPYPVFAGMVTEEQGRRLFLCPRGCWDRLRKHLVSIATFSTTGFVAQAGCREIEIVDQLALLKCSQLPTPLPKAPVTVFGVRHTHGCTWTWQDTKDPLAPIQFINGASNQPDDQFRALNEIVLNLVK